MNRKSQIWINVKLIRNGSVKSQLGASTMRRIKNRFYRIHTGKLNDREHYLVRIDYAPHAHNSFTATTKKEVFENLEIFTAASEVRFIRKYLVDMDN